MKPFLLLILASALYAQTPTVTFPATGAKAVAGNPSQDANWTIVSNSLGGESGSGPAAIVTSFPSTWVKPPAGVSWISVQPDQSEVRRPATCCQGESHYEVKFNVDDPAKAVMQFTIGASADMDLYLNGYDLSHVIYSPSEPTFDRPVTLTLSQGQVLSFPGLGSTRVQFVPGLNTLRAVVGNFRGGPTGVFLSPVIPAPLGPLNLTHTRPGFHPNLSLLDPADSASGQFFDKLVDFQLGGPMRLTFERFYSSQLSLSGASSALGTNWMSNYDLVAVVNGTKAQVLMPGGLVVTFNSSGGQWRLASPLARDYEFAAGSGGGYLFKDPTENRIYTFSTAGALTKIEDRNGNSINVTAGSSGPAKVTDGLGRSLTFTYSANQLTSVQDQSGRAVTFAYTGGLLTSVSDFAKAVTNYTYTSSGSRAGLLTKETLPLGNAPLTQTYDASARVATQAGPSANTTKISYSGGLLVLVSDPDGGITQLTNDAAGNGLQNTDPAGNSIIHTYDSSQRLASTSDSTGATIQFAYDQQASQVAAVTDASGQVTTYSYQPQTKTPFTFYDLASVQHPGASAPVNFAYDTKGNLTSVTMPDQTTARYTYDNNGRLTQATNALGNSTNYGWNTDGTAATVQDALGNTYGFEYDAQKRITKATDSNGRVETYAYDAADRETTYVVPGQTAWQQHFNANGVIDSVTTPLGGQFTFTYNSAGFVETQTDPLKNANVFSYDTLNRVSKVQMPSGESLTYTRDKAGNLIAATDATGAQIQMKNDRAGRIVSQTDATQRTTTYAYTKSGEPTTITSALGNVFAFGYDAQGKILSRTNPLGDAYTFAYDTNGRLNGITSPGGYSTSLTLDAMGSPTSMTSANGNTWTATYDPLQRISSLTDPLGNSTTFIYQGTRLSEIDFPLGSVTYKYDSFGNISTAAFSDGATVNSTYNAMGQILTSNHLALERNTLGQITKANGMAITRDAGGRTETLTYAPGKTVTYSYDKAGLVASVADWSGGKTTFTYDKAGRRIAQTLPNGVATTYDFDADGRATGITYGTLGSIQLTFDANGRITSADRNLPVMPTLQDGSDQFSFNAAGQLVSATYDSMGRVTAQGSRNYTWNLASEMTAFADPVNSGTMTYDGALGEMWSTTSSGAEQTFVFNYATHYPSLCIVRQSGADRRYYVYLPDGELLYSIDAKDGSRSFSHFDEMGNTAFLTDGSGALTDSYGITPYGEVVDHVGTSDNPFTWQGQYGTMQQGAGLFYMRSRHYDAATARFLSLDPDMDAEPQTSEPYAYGRGNPMLYTDPFGSGWFDGIIKAVKDAITYIFTPAPVKKAAPVVSRPKTVSPPAGLLPPTRVPLPISVYVTPVISKDGNNFQQDLQKAIKSGVISNDGSTVIQKLANLITNDGGSLRVLDELISQDGAGLRALVSLIGQDGAGFTKWAKLITQDGGSLLNIQRLISQDGAGLFAGGVSGLFSGNGSFFDRSGGASFTPRAYSLTSLDTPQKAKNNKRVCPSLR